MKSRPGSAVSRMRSIAARKPRARPSKWRTSSWNCASNMGKRRAVRRAALQYHFWRDLHGGDGPETIEEFWALCPAKNKVQLFARPLIEGMLAHLPEIDERITRYCENYEFRRISAVDRNILRLAIYEMLYRDDIPPVVSINEA